MRPAPCETTEADASCRLCFVMRDRLRLGQLLVDTGMITREQLDEALSKQQDDSRRLGEILVDEGLLSESQVTQVLSQQLSMPWVALQHIDFSRQLLNLVPKSVAERYGVVPIYVRRARNRQETLYVAMQDPLDLAPLREIEEYAGLPVRPMIAPATDIKGAVRAYYLGLPPEQELEDAPQSVPPAHGHPAGVSVPPLAPRPPEAAEAPAEPARSSGSSALSNQSIQAKSPERDGGGAAAESDEEKPPSSRPVHSRGSGMPQPKSRTPRMVTVTMLDGTQITLPAAGSKKQAKEKIASSEASEETPGMTAHDLVDALRAQASGADASEVLGQDVNWESLFAALLSLLLKKHLIADWEFVRELHR